MAAGHKRPLRIGQSGNRGVILISVMFLIVLLGMIIWQMQFSTGIEKQIADHRADALHASYRLKSKIELAKLSILQGSSLKPAELSDEDTSHIPDDYEEPAETPDVSRDIIITDASSRLNINMLVGSDGKPNKNIQKAVDHVLRRFGLDPDISNDIIDCISSEKKSGSEHYCNRLFQNISEIGLINAIPGPLLGSSAGKETLKLYDVFTVHSRGRINVNTAPYEVLASIIVNDSYEQAVLNIIEEREHARFRAVADIFRVEGASRGMFGYFERFLTVTPTVFIVDASDTSGKITRRARAVFEKRRNNVVMLSYIEE